MEYVYFSEFDWKGVKAKRVVILLFVKSIHHLKTLLDSFEQSQSYLPHHFHEYNTHKILAYYDTPG